MDEKKAYVEELERQMEIWSRQIEKLENRLREAGKNGSSVSREALTLIGELRRAQLELRNRITRLQSSENHWDHSVRDDTDSRVNRFKASYARAVTLLPPD